MSPAFPPAAPFARAMALAAGFGARMRPLTDARPKPLIEVAGRSLLDRALDRLAAAGVRETVVNAHYLGAQIEAHAREWNDAGWTPALTVSPEVELLDTGGGVKLALPLLGAGPFFVVNSDALWLDGPTPALRRLAAAWDPHRMDALLLLHPACAAFGVEIGAMGDYMLSPDGTATRRRSGAPVPFLFAGVSVCEAGLFDGAPAGAFSLRTLWDRAEERGRLYGLRHDGLWFHVGTPEALAETEAWFRREAHG
jgi:MurNAc alpha-1-phosphate uridylyltransferase